MTYTLADFKAGDRVQTHPATDAWMMGDRYGTVERVSRSFVWVRMDKSNRLRWWHPQSLIPLHD